MAEEDIISTLPDAILCHILSFLQTKQSAFTSILSNRWKYIWLSVPSLYFKTTLTTMNQNFHFNDNVYTVLLSRNSPVKSLRLKVTYSYSQILYLDGPINSVTKWINFVVQRGVECLNVRLIITTDCKTDHYLLKLPISIVTCKTLVILKLYNFDVEKGFSFVELPSLKVLELQQFRFPKLRDFMLFLTACPILEDLIIYDLYFNSEESLTCDEWNSFCLSNLTIASIDCFHLHLTLKVVQNITSLRVEIDPADTYEVTWTRKDDRENWVDQDFVPQCLSLQLRTCTLYTFLGLQGELQLARYILKNSKLLQNLTIWNWGEPKLYSLLSSSPTASPTCKLTFRNFKQTTGKNNDDDDDDDESDDDGDDDNDDDDML